MTTVGTKYTNRSRARRVKAGLCAYCGKPRGWSRFMCDAHAEAHRLRQRKPVATVAAVTAATADPAVERRAEHARKIMDLRSDGQHEPPTPRPVAQHDLLLCGPAPRTAFVLKDRVCWFDVHPGEGDREAARVEVIGVVIAQFTRMRYLVRACASGAECLKAFHDLRLVANGKEPTNGNGIAKASVNRVPRLP